MGTRFLSRPEYSRAHSVNMTEWGSSREWGVGTACPPRPRAKQSKERDQWTFPLRSEVRRERESCLPMILHNSSTKHASCATEAVGVWRMVATSVIGPVGNDSYVNVLL